MGSQIGFLLLDASFTAVFADPVVQHALTGLTDDSPTFETALARFIATIGTLITAAQLRPDFEFGGRRWRWSQFSCNCCEGGPQTLHAFVLGPEIGDFSHSTALAGMYRLTPREAQALEHYLHGLAVKEVADSMGVTPSTAKTFLRSICGKMGVTSRSELMSRILNFTCSASFNCPFKVAMSTPGLSKSKY